ncbi:EAL domain-containing protein [Gallaecimonas kandeliae]|uniref:bifunctional diguanylate cyclase/phosphodiesterase n=1 Tax=Gallaecimonas kandeliae TaxID=3029055 RepID=UPI00264708A3|nr:EAL domain-containing protein [Gallaecimonas kandeliae]WKE65373.1 EAL domain-containing protein [Gallaecimonas kandeliae]
MKKGEAGLLPEQPDSALLAEMVDTAPLALAGADQGGQLHHFNPAFALLLEDAGLTGKAAITALFTSLDQAKWQGLCKRAEQAGLALSLERTKGGQLFELSLRGRQHWPAAFTLCLKRCGPDFHRESIQLLQSEVLQAVAQGEPLHHCMELLCKRVETLAPELLCTVLLVDDDGKVHPCAAPSMAPLFSDAIDGEPIGPKAGSCGTAAWRRQPVEVTDIATDPLWEHYKALALPLGLAACWSSPILFKDGKVAGTFALYYREKRGPSAFHRQMVETCVHICALAMEHERAQQQIHRLVFFDPLTGLPNRSLLRDRLEQALTATRFSRAPLAALFIDLDNFKAINESLGHAVGDQLLQLLAGRLQDGLSHKHTLARTGGDEFLLLAIDTDANQARTLAEGLLARIQIPVQLAGRELSISASIGISLAPEDATNVDTLLRNTEIALHQAKDSGRNTWSFYKAAMNESAQLRHQQLAALRRAMAEKSLVLHYQPQISVKEARLAGLEVLARCQDPALGNIPPAVFIPLAEESGLICNLDCTVLEQALVQLTAWRRQGLAIPAVAVNLSALDFRQPDLVERIQALLQEQGLSGADLTLEITEGLLIESNDQILATMERLRALGISLSIDDFGTGFSSLSYLKRFPVAELKVDRSFIRDIETDPSDRTLTAAVIQLGASFGLRVVAEGVETQEQLELVTGLGCDLIQGYHFAAPMTAPELALWLTGDGKAWLPQ